MRVRVERKTRAQMSRRYGRVPYPVSQEERDWNQLKIHESHDWSKHKIDVLIERLERRGERHMCRAA